jgi:hypothetical protein
MCRFAADLLPTLRIIAGKNIDKLKLDTKVGSSFFTLLLLLNFNLHFVFFFFGGGGVSSSNLS